MRKKIVALVLMAALCLSCLFALGEGAAPAASFNGAKLGMSQRQVRWVMGVQPLREIPGLGGYAALLYQTKVDGFPCNVQYSFLPGDTLYSIEAAVEDPEMDYFDKLAEEYKEQLGEPRKDGGAEPADGADAEPVDPADRDGETLIWQPDAETMVVLSFDWAGDTTRVVIWRTNEEFQIAIDTEQ